LCSFCVLVRCERITTINYEDSNEGFQRQVISKIFRICNYGMLDWLPDVTPADYLNL
jgi:hypothetical protein